MDDIPVPPGFVLVPAEPTPEMLAAGTEALWQHLRPGHRRSVQVTVYRPGCETDAMLAWRAMVEVARGTGS